MRYGESEQSHSNSDILKSKRSMPQLDGVWKGFLKELDEDPLTFQLPSNLAQTHSHHNSQPRCRGHRSVSSSIPKSKSTHDLSVHADMPPPGRRNKPLQRSPFSEPLYTPLSSPKPNRPKLILSQTPKDPLHELDEGDLTLSFPAPPPLFIRRKVGPLPALKPRSDTPPSPAMCSSTSSSDSTPVATPTTATPTQSSPKIPPLMITKKSSSSVIAPLSPTASIPSPSSPRDFSDPRSRSLRLIQSISDLPSSRSRAPGGPKMSLDRERDLRTVSSARRRCSSQKNPKPTAETQYPYSQNPPQGPLEWDVGVAF
ncbi:hypothetical protein K435DRAFT_869818 [Dendrothele bispora CBS 962.96]|uniref:Uncharacterized protein n=1 Tax=Dendrothele bispora (strain CBS 962.96) TaxID=1314807 RepID=A0A4S8L8I9_DENBC|nr:hypothetical protein K435DRAFT_869818 [Dendrothele bispora CBS 962.96]